MRPDLANLPETVRTILRGLKKCHTPLRLGAWLQVDCLSHWVTPRLVMKRDHPPLARGSARIKALRSMPGSFLRLESTGSTSLALFATANSLVEMAAADHIHARVREQLVVVWETAVDAIITIDERGTVFSCNPATERLFGYSMQELVGHNISKIMPRPYREEHDHFLSDYLATGKKKIIGIGRRVPGQRKDGHIFPAYLSVSEFFMAGQRYFTGILRDISDVIEARTRAAVEERRHLSRELHDSVSQALFGIVLGSQAALNSLNTDNPDQLPAAKESLAYVLSLAESGLSEMRTLMFELRPESLEAEGLLVSLRRQASALAKRYQIEADFFFPTTEPQVSLTIKHEVYRFVMEALHNVVKHSRAKLFTLRLEHAQGNICAEVVDDGVGFDPRDVPAGHIGLQSMRERVASLGGILHIDSAPGRGTRLQAVLMQGETLS